MVFCNAYLPIMVAADPEMLTVPADDQEAIKRTANRIISRLSTAGYVAAYSKGLTILTGTTLPPVLSGFSR